MIFIIGDILGLPSRIKQEKESEGQGCSEIERQRETETTDRQREKDGIGDELGPTCSEQWVVEEGCKSLMEKECLQLGGDRGQFCSIYVHCSRCFSLPPPQTNVVDSLMETGKWGEQFTTCRAGGKSVEVTGCIQRQ